MDILSVNTIAVTILDYPMSYVELVGTICYLWSVWLIARRNIWTWPIGIISVILYMLLFYQIRLYSDTVEQIYYLVASIYGWWFWYKSAQHKRGETEKIPADVYYSSQRVVILSISLMVVLSIAAATFFSQAHILLPAIFPAPAAYPLLDALTTVMSFVAMWLMAQKRTESWIYWIIVDVLQIGLYHALGVRFVELLYGILLVMAINGFRLWHKAVIARRNNILLSQATA